MEGRVHTHLKVDSAKINGSPNGVVAISYVVTNALRMQWIYVVCARTAAIRTKRPSQIQQATERDFCIVVVEKERSIVIVNARLLVMVGSVVQQEREYG